MPQDKSPNKTRILKSMMAKLADSRSPDSDWPELSKSWAGREIEMPVETAATKTVRPMNFLEKFIQPDASAVTWPWGTIALNRDVIDRNQKMSQGDELGDTLVHELTHIGQGKKLGLFGALKQNLAGGDKKYYDRPEEKEAFQREYNRKVRKENILLK